MIKRIKGVNCCLNCPDRKEGCHANCDKYLSERKAYEEYKQKIQAERNKQSGIEAYEAARNKQIKKGREKK